MRHDRTALERYLSHSAHARPPHGATAQPSYRRQSHPRVPSARSRTRGGTPRAALIGPTPAICAAASTADVGRRYPGLLPHRPAAATRCRHAHKETCRVQTAPSAQGCERRGASSSRAGGGGTPLLRPRGAQKAAPRGATQRAGSSGRESGPRSGKQLLMRARETEPDLATLSASTTCSTRPRGRTTLGTTAQGCASGRGLLGMAGGQSSGPASLGLPTVYGLSRTACVHATVASAMACREHMYHSARFASQRMRQCPETGALC